ncbi:MAG: hypothetical protein GKR96_12435 [Gammaproteobacteria bacterium]|nr:hypothetical protein [Gammaproteobacteria bacterium]
MTFHDGTSFNASVAKHSLSRAWEQPSVLGKAPIAGITKGENSVVFTLKKPFAALPALLAHATAIVTALSAFDTEGNLSSFVGTGPFKVTKFTPLQSIELSHNDTYWGDAPDIETVNYLADSRAET